MRKDKKTTTKPQTNFKDLKAIVHLDVFLQVNIVMAFMATLLIV